MGGAHGSCGTVAFCLCAPLYVSHMHILKVACFSLVYLAVHDGFWLYFEEAAGVTQADRCLRCNWFVTEQSW